VWVVAAVAALLHCYLTRAAPLLAYMPHDTCRQRWWERGRHSGLGRERATDALHVRSSCRAIPQPQASVREAGMRASRGR
jgi:hypothetical protein